MLQEQLTSDGVDFHLQAHIETVGKDDATGGVKLLVTEDGVVYEYIVEHLLLTTGRTPNVDNMGLEEAKVELAKHKGIKVKHVT